jgi:phage-related baseplate assembly protein
MVRMSRPDLPPLDTLGLETEPMTTVLQAYAYRETLLRALVNDKARAVMLAYATGTDLEHLGARFGVTRMVMVPANPVTGAAAIMEDDERLRRRIQLAPEAFSTCGPRGAYIFYALSLDGSIADAWAYSPSDGEVSVVVAGAGGADISDSVIATLIDRFADDDTVPLTDAVTVRRAVRLEYAVNATLQFPRGPDPDVIIKAAGDAIKAYTDSHTRIAATVYRNGIISVARLGTVDDVILASPAANVVCDDVHIPVATAITVTASVAD